MAFGKYRLIAELGHGGMADVFLAVQAGPAGSGFRKLTVIKRLRENLADEPEFVAMLVDEARIAARLNHPNVVQTNEVGNVGSHYFIAMEYLDGQPLHRIQHRSLTRAKNGGKAPLTPELQYLILMDALAGLHHAHELADYDGTPLNIVHRDVTPQNIFVTYEGQVKVVDFGIAKAAGRALETRQGVVKGKVRYMAPEQAVGLAVSRRSDVFAVGIMLWEAAVGRRMWKDKDDLQIVQALVSGDLPPMPHELDPSVPEGIDRICRKALALRPEDRHATAEELRLELEEFLAELKMLVPARRQLPPVLSELFNDKRTEIRGIIEQQLATIEDAAPVEELTQVPQDPLSSRMLPSSAPAPSPGPGSERSRTLVSAESPLSATVSGTASPGVVPAAPASTTAASSSSSSSSSPSSSKRRSVVAVVALAIVGIVALGVWKTSVSRANTTASSETAKKVEEVSIHLTATPAHARVSVDDAPLRPLPLDLRVPRDDHPHRVRVEADGYEPHTETLSFAHDVGKSFELTAAHPAAASPPAGSTPSTKSEPASAGKRTPPPPHPTHAAAAAFRPPPTTKAAEPKAEPAPPPSPTHPPAQPPSTQTDAKGRNLNIDKNDPWNTKQ